MSEGRKISELQPVASPQLTDFFPVINNGQTRRLTLAQLRSALTGTHTPGVYNRARITVTPTGTLVIEPSDLTGIFDLAYGTITAGSTEDVVFTVTGAALGSPVLAAFAAGPSLSLEISAAWVSAVDQVTVRVRNFTGGSVGPGTISTRILVLA
jgi:hypothetical protein